MLLALVANYCGSAFAEAEEEKKVQINFAGLDLATLARQVERVTKKTLVFDENLLRNIKTTLQSETSITPAEFYRVFQTVCQMNDLTLVPVENAGIDLVKIVKSQVAFKEPGVHLVLTRGDELPMEDHIVSYLLKVKHAAPSRVLAAITPSLSPSGSALQVANSDLLMINDVASSVKRVERIATLLDVEGEPVTTVSVPIKNIGVDKAHAQLTEYLQAISKLSTGEAGRDRVVFLRDERLNVLTLVGSESEVRKLEAYLKSLDVDSPGSKRTIRYYKLNNVPVKDVVDYVSQLLGLALATRTQEKPAPTADANNATQTFIPPQGGGPVQQPPLLGGQTPPARELPSPATVMAKSSANPKLAAAGIPADIIPVEGLNTLVVAGDAAVHEEVESILANLDKRKGQVLIEVAIVQVTGDDSIDLGLEGLSINNANRNSKQLDFGTGFGIGQQSDTGRGVGGSLLGRGFPTETALGGVTGAAFRFVNEDRLQVVLSALATKANVSIVSQPLLLVNDNEAASFTTKVSEPTVTTSQGTATTNTSFSGFADATTSLKITPHISPEGYLNLEITQTFEEFTGASAGGGIPPPKVSNNADTKVTIPDRQTIVIGGFTRDSAQDGRSGVPGLMKVPGLGKLFSRETKRKTTSRLYLFVRPKILATENFTDLQHESARKKEDVERQSKKSKIKEEIRERLKDEAPVGEVIEIYEEKK